MLRKSERRDLFGFALISGHVPNAKTSLNVLHMSQRCLMIEIEFPRLWTSDCVSVRNRRVSSVAAQGNFLEQDRAADLRSRRDLELIGV